MYGYVAIAILTVVAHNVDAAAPPLRVTIDCGSREKDHNGRVGYRSKTSNSRFDVNSFCNLIHEAIPKGVKNGRFILREPDLDQTGYSDTIVPKFAPPPEGFIPKFALPKFKASKLKIPNINVPKLEAHDETGFSPPRIDLPNNFPLLRSMVEESSAERMEKFKKGVQKMLHVVKVLGQIDQYLSERTRILVDKLAKTFAD